jgi:hypothetical protein
MGKKSREIITNNYGLSIQANHYLQLYQELLDSSPVNITNSSLFSASNTTANNRGLYFEKIYADLALYSIQQELKNTHQELNKTGKKLQETRRILAQHQETITAMESSKFWSLRQKWFKIKNLFGLSSEK